jgi:integrase
MTVPLVIEAVGPKDLLSTYIDHIRGLSIGKCGCDARRRSARRFLEHHPDLGAWLARPTPGRVADLHRDEAWPFVVWAGVAGRVRLDVELLLAKPGGVDLSAVWDRLHPGDIQRAEAVCAGLSWSANWVRQVARHSLPVVCTWAAKRLDALNDEDLAGFRAEVERSAHLTESAREKARNRLFAVGQICFQLGSASRPPRRGVSEPARTPAELAALISQPAIRREVVRYAETISTVLRPASGYTRVKAVRVFFDWLAEVHPEVRRLDHVDRQRHIEPFLAWERQRPWRGANGRGRTISLLQFHHDIVDLRVFFEDIAAWGWASSPRRRLLFLTDLPRLPEPMPRALPPEADTALMAAVGQLRDPFARTGLVLLRETGMRVGELLDLELDCLIDFADHGTWLRVPLGKLGTERTVPIEAPTLEMLDDWISARGHQRALPHPRHGRPADFVFMEHGRRPTKFRLAKGLNSAAADAGLVGVDGSPMRLTVHQLRHTFGTSLVNAGMSLPALMALMGHVTPDMTLRYARLASPTIRSAYDAAMGKVRARSHLVIGAGRHVAVPSRVDWLAGEMLKTRVAHGYCSRELAAGACPYSNICEQCDNFVATPEFAATIEDQLADVRALHDDAIERGWDAEASRHGRVADSLEEHLRRLSRGDGTA